MYSFLYASLFRSLANLLHQDSTLTHYSLASPMFDPASAAVSLPPSVSQQLPQPINVSSAHAHAQAQDTLLDNSNLCDILMLERALENEAALGNGGLGSLGREIWASFFKI